MKETRIVPAGRADSRRRVAEACLSSLDAVDRACVAPCLPERAAPPSDRELRIAHSVWRLRRAFAAASTPEVVAAVTGLAHRLAGRHEEIREVLAAWADVIDDLTAAAQRAYGSDPKRGDVKKDVVKAALVRYVRDAGIGLEGVPDVFEPFVFAAAADLVVDAVYRVSRQQAGWSGEPGRWPRLRSARRWLTRPLLWLTRGLTRVSWWLVLRHSPLTPELTLAIDRAVVRAKTDRAKVADAVREAFQGLGWIVEHRRALIALIDAALCAMHEAEITFSDGEDKAVYARDLVVEFLVQEGVIERGRLGQAFVEAGLDFFFSSAVRVLHKRRVYSSKAERAAAVAAGTPLPVVAADARVRVEEALPATAGETPPVAGGQEDRA